MGKFGSIALISFMGVMGLVLLWWDGLETPWGTFDALPWMGALAIASYGVIKILVPIQKKKRTWENLIVEQRILVAATVGWLLSALFYLAITGGFVPADARLKSQVQHARVLWMVLVGGTLAGTIGAVSWLSNRDYNGDLARFLHGDEPNYDHKKTRDYVGKVRNGSKPLKQQVAGETITTRGASLEGDTLTIDPGTVTVREGTAAILEQKGRITRIVECGEYHLDKGERATMGVPLYERNLRVRVDKVRTRDQVVFEEISLEIRHRVQGTRTRTPAEMQTSPPPPTRFEYDDEVLRFKLWNPEHKPYTEILRVFVESQVRAQVGRLYFEDLYAGTGGARAKLDATLKNELTSFMMARGVSIEMAALMDMQVEPELYRVLQQRRKAELARQGALIRAQTRRDTQMISQDARVALRDALIQHIADPLRDKNRGAILDSEIGKRYLEAIENLTRIVALGEDLTPAGETIEGTAIPVEPAANRGAGAPARPDYSL